MTEKYENYNSLYPVAYYEIGKVYAFYGSTHVCAEAATSQQVADFKGVLEVLTADAPADPIGKESKLHRYYAVVVDKQPGSLIVMFKNQNNGKSSYLIKSYIADAGCDTDGKDLMPTSAVTYYPVEGTPGSSSVDPDSSETNKGPSPVDPTEPKGTNKGSSPVDPDSKPLDN